MGVLVFIPADIQEVVLAAAGLVAVFAVVAAVSVAAERQEVGDSYET